MQFNKCSRCGSFFVSSGDVCPNCAPKDKFEMNKLQNFLEDSDINFMPGQGGGDGPLQYTVYRIKDDAEPNQSFYIDPSQVTDVTNSTSWAFNKNNHKLTINMPTNDPYKPGYEPSNSRYIITYTTTYNSNTQTQQGEYEVPINTDTNIHLNGTYFK